MSDYAFVADRARRAFASVARLESALSRDPTSRSLQINLAAKRKLAKQTQEQMLKLAELNHIEICNYRLLPETAESYALPYVSKSMLEYQYLFSQVHDAVKNGRKQRAVIGKEAWEESLLEFGYTYDGSLGVVLLAQGHRDIFESGDLDASIDALFQVIEITDQDSVRDVARTLGNAVVKRVHDWSEVNVAGGFAADVRWNRSDGRQLGEVVERRRMEKIVGLIQSTSDTKTTDHSVSGILVGLEVIGGAFRFVDPQGEDFRGSLHEDFPRGKVFGINRPYQALIEETTVERYATEKIERKFALKKLENQTEPEQLAL